MPGLAAWPANGFGSPFWGGGGTSAPTEGAFDEGGYMTDSE